ncbi:MAG: hypothetical protein IT584_01060 [Chlamydiae bacterium]|nr:hypothetical protein [Chlamydiota bacterium]
MKDAEREGLAGEMVWTFQGLTYCSNDGVRWERAASRRGPSSTEEYLAEFAKRGSCLRGHSGVYLDRTLYSVGIWCCVGLMPNGEKCFFHLDNQYPNGIPKVNW